MISIPGLPFKVTETVINKPNMANKTAITIGALLISRTAADKA